MKKANLFSIILNIVIISFVIISFFLFLPKVRVLYFEIINPCFWFLLFIVTFIKSRNDICRKKYKYDFLQIILICVSIYLIFFYLIGLITGYSSLPYNHSFIGIIKNLWSYVIIVFFQEYIRQVLLNRSGNKKLIFAFIVVLFSIVDIINFSYGYIIKNFTDLFRYIYIIVIAEFSKNLLLSYLTYKSDFIPSFIYKFLLQITIYVIPIMPSLNWFLEGSLKLILPFFVYLICSNFYEVKQTKKQKRKNKKFNITILILVLIIFPLVALVSGIFKFQVIAIASNSMVPIYKRGDAVIFEKIDLEKKNELKKNNIIVFKKDNQLILHRVENIEYTISGNKHYITKGDNNNVIDEGYIMDEDIIGLYKSKIPMIGFPSVWLKELID